MRPERVVTSTSGERFNGANAVTFTNCISVIAYLPLLHAAQATDSLGRHDVTAAMPTNLFQANIGVTRLAHQGFIKTDPSIKKYALTEKGRETLELAQTAVDDFNQKHPEFALPDHFSPRIGPTARGGELSASIVIKLLWVFAQNGVLQLKELAARLGIPSTNLSANVSEALRILEAADILDMGDRRGQTERLHYSLTPFGQALLEDFVSPLWKKIKEQTHAY